MSVYSAVLKHDNGRFRINVTATGGVAGAVRSILCAEACPKSAIVSMTKILRSGRKLRVKHW